MYRWYVFILMEIIFRYFNKDNLLHVTKDLDIIGCFVVNFKIIKLSYQKN
ncbi:hypothetical protein [Clostridium sp. DL1XJH146]